MRVFTYSLLTLMLVASANAQTPDDPAIEACRTTGLLNRGYPSSQSYHGRGIS